MLNLVFKQCANQLQVGLIIIHCHHAHGQFLLVVNQRESMLAKTAILRERGQEAGRGERFQQTRGGSVVFQLLCINLGVAGQRQQQIVGH